MQSKIELDLKNYYYQEIESIKVRLSKNRPDLYSKTQNVKRLINEYDDISNQIPKSAIERNEITKECLQKEKEFDLALKHYNDIEKKNH